jgi:two-component system, LytTR family, response regulator
MSREGGCVKDARDKIRTFIADDERPARSFLAFMLRAFEEVEIVGEAANGIEAVTLIEALHPDLVFLDIQMPDVDGFEIVGLLKKPLPLLAFVSGYDEYADRARQLDAIDYLLKPASAARLSETLSRVRKRRHNVQVVGGTIP